MRRKRLKKRVKVQKYTPQNLEKTVLGSGSISQDPAMVYFVHSYKRRWRSKDEPEALNLKIHGFFKWGRA